jgi:uncharacterized protein YaaW (UPF0174 family)
MRTVDNCSSHAVAHCSCVCVTCFNSLEGHDHVQYSIASASALYADTSIANHIHDMAQLWSVGSQRVKDQLMKVSLENDELNTVTNELMMLAEKYRQN